MLTTAYTLASYLHAGQRYGKGPFISHITDVHAIIAALYPDDVELQAAAYLHDAVEDAPEGMDARQMIAVRCGAAVLDLVEAVTDEPGASRAERKAKTLPKTAAAGWRAVALKLADRVCNMRAAGRAAAMYRAELPAFRAALFEVTTDRPELAPLWAELDRLGVAS